MSFDLGNALKTLAPTLAAMLGGPLAGTAVTALEGAFGLAPGAGTAAITQVLQSSAMTPEQAAAVRAADQQYQVSLGQQNIDLAKLNSDHDTAMAATDEADRASARTRQSALKDNMPAYLAVLILAAAGGIAYVVLSGNTPAFKDPATAATAGTVVGYVFSELKAAFAFYFGTTASGQAKDQTISDIAKS